MSSVSPLPCQTADILFVDLTVQTRISHKPAFPQMTMNYPWLLKAPRCAQPKTESFLPRLCIHILLQHSCMCFLSQLQSESLKKWKHIQTEHTDSHQWLTHVEYTFRTQPLWLSSFMCQRAPVQHVALFLRYSDISWLHLVFLLRVEIYHGCSSFLFGCGRFL